MATHNLLVIDAHGRQLKLELKRERKKQTEIHGIR